MFALIHKHY